MMKQNSGMQYDVFINHRGSDVKNSIASLIYNQLKTKDPTLRVFLDQKEIPCGVDFSYAIETAIQSSSVHIAIFSKHYAESSWCLHELDLIIKSKRKLIPVFCDVNPASLRRIEKGCYQKAFEKHRRREPVEKTKRWEDALSRASYLQGLTFKMKENDHWDFVEKMVGIVLMNLKEGLSVDAKYPVALEQGAEDFPVSASELEDLKGCQEFITEELALAGGLDLIELSQADGLAISKSVALEQGAEDFPVSASELEGLKGCQEFITEEFALAGGLDLIGLSRADGLAVSKSIALEQGAEDFRVSASDLEDLKGCQEFITEEFALAGGLDLIELSRADGLTVNKLFEDEEEDELAISKLFERDDDGPATGLDDDRLHINELSVADGPAVSELFEDEDGLAPTKLFAPDDDGPAIGLDDDRPDLSELSGADGPTVSELFEVDEDGLGTSKLFEQDDDGPAISKLFELDDEDVRLLDKDVREAIRLFFKFLEFLSL